MHEFALIERYFAGFPGADTVLTGIGDDAAVLRPPANQLLVQSSDTLISGVHFPEDAPAADVAYKALMVNLSDIAAMGATPLWYTLALTLPEVNEAWLKSFSEMLRQVSDEMGVALIGGDTTSGTNLALTITITGAVAEGAQVLRSGAQIGDQIFVTGNIGDGALGLALWQERIKSVANAEPCLERFYRPTARTEFGHAVGSIATAMVDISDGLFSDLGHILKQSSCGADIQYESIPVSESLQSVGKDAETRIEFINGGDDYELVVCLPPAAAEQAQALAQELDCPLHCIGEITDSQKLRLLGEEGRELNVFQSGYQHFV